MDINDLRSVFTVLTFVAFVGIVMWAYSGRRKQAFDEAANLPLDDDLHVVTGGNTGANSTDK